MSERRLVWIAVVVISVWTWAAAAVAQPGPPPHGPGSAEWEELMNKISLLRNFKLIEALDLDEESAAKLAVYLKDREEERLEVLAQKSDVHKRIREWGDSGEDDDQAKELLAQALEFDEREHDLNHELIKGLDGILTPSQQLKFVLVNREFDREVQDIIREHKREQHREHRDRGGPR